jgi:diguanylate cyclase (GGDEF)-like protein
MTGTRRTGLASSVLDTGDAMHALQRFASAVWLSVAAVALLILPFSASFEPGTPRRLLGSAAFAIVAAALTRRLPRPHLVIGDLALRTGGFVVLFENVRHNLTPDTWLLCLPMFLSGILIPALFYRAVPMAIASAEVTLLTAFLAVGADAPTTISLLTWGSFMWIKILIIVVIQRLATERRHTMEQLEAIASTDVLTGLANRRQFMAAASQMLASSHAEQTACTLMLLDLDHFKQVNDAHGHDAGDQVLVGVAGALTGAARTDDLIARLGGEEFAVLLRGASALHAQHIASAASSAMRALRPVGVTASYGIVEAKLGERDVSELLLRADTALYKAKHAGRDRAVVAV